jgi:hypothetical protein
MACTGVAITRVLMEAFLGQPGDACRSVVRQDGALDRKLR